MEVLVKVNHNRIISIEVGLTDTVFNIKEKVAKSLGLSIPKAHIYFNGKLLQEHLTVHQCQIRDKSHLELFLNIQPPSNQVNELTRQLLQLHQAEQSSQVPSVKSNNQDSTLRNVFPVSRNTNVGSLGSQDQSVMASMLHQTSQFQPSPHLLNQYRSFMASSGNQMFNQNNQFQASPNLRDQYRSFMASSGYQMLNQNSQFQASPNLLDKYQTIMPSSVRNDQMLNQTNQFQQPNWLNEYWSLMGSSNNSGQLPQETKVRPDFQPAEEFLGLVDVPMQSSGNNRIQDLPGSGNNQAFQTEQSPVRLGGSFGDMMFGEDRPLQVEDFANIQNYWPEASNAGKEVIDIPDSPVRGDKIRILILPYSREERSQVKFAVYVNPRENVSELRKDLVKIEGLILPEEGYFFISKNGVVYNEEQSFLSEGIGHGDTLEVFPGLNQRTHALEVFPGQLIKDPRLNQS